MSDNQIKVTVIMPSLNVGDYIEECILSVINQSLSEIEIICVDAGSTDNTLDILNKYAEKDNRISIISSDEKSYGHQVNLGLLKAKGEYISIVETDDFIAEDMLERLYSLSDEGTVDIVKGTFYHYNDYDKDNIIMDINNEKADLITSKKFTLKQYPRFIDGHPSIWAGIYRKEFLDANEITLVEVPGGGWVDNPFFYETAITAESIVYIHEPVYYYRVSNPNSSTNTLKDFTIPMDRILEMFKINEKLGCDDEGIIVMFYNRLFRYIEIIIENNNNCAEDLDYPTCLKIHEVVKKVDVDIVDRRLKPNFQRLYLTYASPLCLVRFESHAESSYKEFRTVPYPEEGNYAISIIMPVFNGAKFLERSVDSLLKQTLKQIEIVFIDDGSTDNTLEILRDYEKNYDFVTVLTQENSGSGKARNYGIDEAKGEYIGFLDADDFYIDDDALEKMYEIAVLNDANMVTANIKHDLNNEGDFIPFGPFRYYTSNEVILPEQYGIPWSFYKNIFKKDFLIENQIYFPDLLRGQDPVFLAEALTKVDKIYVAATDLYAYVYNSDTAKANNPKKLYDQLLHYRQVIDYLNEPKFSRRRNEYFEKIFLFSSRLDDESVADAIKSMREIFQDMPDFLRRIENYLYLKFGHVDEVKELIPWTKISAIMEISRPKKFYEKAIKSLRNQTIGDFELILINGLEDGEFEGVKDMFEEDDSVKFIESDKENVSSLKNLALSEATGDYVYFCDDEHVYENNLFEEFLETSCVTGSDICLCNLPKGGLNYNSELDFEKILGSANFTFYKCGNERIIPYIFTSSFDSSFKFYKKSALKDLSFNEDLIESESLFHIESLLSSEVLSFVPEFLFKYLTKNNIYYGNAELPTQNSNALDIFKVCDCVENLLKEKSLYSELKTYFDIYKINQISSFLDSVRYVGCYSYNDLKNRDLYANNKQVLDYSQYYGSKSDHVGLNYSYANKYFNKAKEEFDNMGYRDLKFLELNNNKFSDKSNLNKYRAVLESDSYEEYMILANFSNVERLKEKNKLLIDANEKMKTNKVADELMDSDKDTLELEINTLKDENKRLIKKENELRDEYWKNRHLYDYILSSRSWKYTKWLRSD